MIKTDKDRWYPPGFLTTSFYCRWGPATEWRTSSKVLISAGYANFKAWLAVFSRAVFLGSPLTTWVRDDVSCVPQERLYSKLHKLFDFVVLAWIANLQRRGVWKACSSLCIKHASILKYCGSELWVREKPAVLCFITRTIATDLTALANRYCTSFLVSC